MKKPKKHHIQITRAYGEQLESVGMDVSWRRDGGFTVKPQMKEEEPKRGELNHG